MSSSPSPPFTLPYIFPLGYIKVYGRGVGYGKYSGITVLQRLYQHCESNITRYVTLIEQTYQCKVLRLPNVFSTIKTLVTARHGPNSNNIHLIFGKYSFKCVNMRLYRPKQNKKFPTEQTKRLTEKYNRGCIFLSVNPRVNRLNIGNNFSQSPYFFMEKGRRPWFLEN